MGRSWPLRLAALPWLLAAGLLLYVWLWRGFAFPQPRPMADAEGPFLSQVFPVEAAATLHRKARGRHRLTMVERTFQAKGSELPALEGRLRPILDDPRLHAQTVLVPRGDDDRQAASVSATAFGQNVDSGRDYEVTLRIFVSHEDLGPWNNLGPHSFTFRNN